ncbi:protein rolling stone-like isoform X1 [Branchiostoma floridae x Branchiostoma belcheri]
MIIEEFETSNLFLAYPDRSVFYSSAWSRRCLVPFLVYRITIAVFTLFIFIYTLGDYIVADYGVAWFSIYATNWTFLIQTVYYNMAAIVTSLACPDVDSRCHERGSSSTLALEGKHKTSSRRLRESFTPGGNGNFEVESDSEDSNDGLSVDVSKAPPDDLCWYHKLMWVLYNTMAPIALLITFLRALAMGFGTSFEWTNHLNPLTDILHHFCNGGIVLVDIFVSATPTRLLHFAHPLAYSFIYNVFLIVYWVSGGWGITGERWVYPVVDYSDEHWRPSVIFVLIGLFVVVPVFHLLVFGLYKLRCALVRCVLGTAADDAERTRLLSE